MRWCGRHSNPEFIRPTSEDVRAYFDVGGYTNRYTNQGVPCSAKNPVASWGRDSTLVNGYGATGGSVSGRFASTSASSAAATDSAAAVPEGGQNLRIRDIQLIEGNVYIYASGTLPSMRYELKAGGEPADLEADGKERYGEGGAKDLIIVKPQTPGAQFFSISTK